MKDDKGLGRREFIKLGAGGLAVSLTACVASPVEDTPANTAGGMEPGEQAMPPPDPGDLVDPTQLLAGNWQEPWVWRPEHWPGAPLELNVVANQSPGRSTSPGNPRPALFSYNGSSPGPTVRVRGDGEVRFRVRNVLGLDEANTPVGPFPDPIDVTPDTRRKICSLVDEQIPDFEVDESGNCPVFIFPEQIQEVLQHADIKPGWTLKGHVNGIHGTHVTNLHTHGLHVFPQTNPDGSYSDDVHLRIVSQANWEARQASGDENLSALAGHEHVGQLDYKMQLWFERDGKRLPHPPGTHWYHREQGHDR
jgi:hypothetical protein